MAKRRSVWVVEFNVEDTGWDYHEIVMAYSNKKEAQAVADSRKKQHPDTEYRVMRYDASKD